jgi:riboflavin-specific deaminase-like protein
VRRLHDPAGPPDRPVDDLYDDLAFGDPPDGSPRAAVALGMVASVDGATARDGRSGGLGGPADAVAFSRLRGACDAVLVGAGTVRAEDYGPPVGTPARRDARVAAGLAASPALVVVTGSADLDPAARVFQPSRTGATTPVVVVTHEQAPAERVAALREVAEVVVLGSSDVDLAALLRWCRERGWRHVLCEGGPSLNGDLLRADLVDEIFVTVAPVVVAGAAARLATGRALDPPVSLSLTDLHDHEGELVLRYRVVR